jgi:NRPS condensation-like uncharacterized protein
MYKLEEGLIMRKAWYKLDNAGKLYSSIMNDRATTIFRLSVYLEDKIDVSLVKKAVDNLKDRFPYYNVLLKKGFFWHYLETTDRDPTIDLEKYYPCMDIKYNKQGIYLYRLLYFENKLSFEFSHIMTDGNEAMVYILSLIYEYLNLKGENIEKIPGLFYKDEIPDPAEFEDGFDKYFDLSNKKRIKFVDAFKLPFVKTEPGIYYIVTGIVESKEIKKLAKYYDSSVGEFLISLYIYSIYKYVIENNLPKKPIYINFPVNLRNVFGSKTMKNFFVSVTPHIDFEKDYYKLEEIIEIVKNYMEKAKQKEFLTRYINRSVRNTNNWLKFFPLIIKDSAMSTIYNIWGESNYTSGFSNLGVIKLGPLEKYIEKIEAYPPPSEGNVIKVASLTYKDKMYITFGKLTEAKDLERIFFSELRKMGVISKIETNYRS